MKVKVPHTTFIEVDISDEDILSMAAKIIQTRIPGHVWEGTLRDRVTGDILRDANTNELRMSNLLTDLLYFKGDRFLE